VSNFNIDNMTKDQIFYINGEKFDIKRYIVISCLSEGNYYHEITVKSHNKEDIQKLYNICLKEKIDHGEWGLFGSKFKFYGYLTSNSKNKEGYFCFLESVDFKCDIEFNKGNVISDSLKKNYTEADINIVVPLDKNGNAEIRKIEKRKKKNLWQM